MEYNIVLENFEGPMDLLFHLIEKNEVDIYDIPISKITDQYIGYLNKMKILDLEITSEFLVMASTLLEIKSKMLLPKIVDEGMQLEIEDVDPREELVRRLIEYKKYKEAADTLKFKEDVQKKIFFKPQEELSEFIEIHESLNLDGIGLEELIKVVNNLIENRKVTNREINIREIQRDEITIDECMSNIKRIISEKKTIRFEDLFQNTITRANIVVTFLSILELIKIRYIIIKQESNFEEILIELR